MAPNYLEPTTDFDVCGNFGIDRFTLTGAEARYPAALKVLPNYLRSMTIRSNVAVAITFAAGGEVFTLPAAQTLTFGSDMRAASLSGKFFYVNGAVGEILEVLFEFTQTP